MKHDPTKCPLCGDMVDGSIPSGTTYDEIFLHLVAKVHGLETRLQQMEWRSLPIGSVSIEDPNDVIGNLARFQEIQERKPWEPKGKVQCEACWDEFGSEACIRPAHEASGK